MTNVDDQSCQTITVTDIVDLTDNSLVGPNQVYIGTLVGDIDGNGDVTMTDVIRARDNNAQPVGQGDNARSDIDRNADINMTDVIKARDLNAHKVTCP